MFTASGKITKVLAIITFIAGIIASIVGAIMLFSVETYSYSRYSSSYSHPYVGLGVLVLLAGPILSWLNANVFYALGEAADSAKDANENVRYLESQIKTLEKKLDNLSKENKDSVSAVVKQIKISNTSSTGEGDSASSAYTDTTLPDGSSFCDMIKDLDSAIAVKKIWTEMGYVYNEDYAEVTAKLDNYANLEQFYGPNKGNIDSLIMFIKRYHKDL